MKRTPLYQEHLECNGKIIEFGGWELPVSYKGYGILKEHENVRNNVGIFDVSHMGEIELIGSDAIKFADWLVPNDVANLEDGQACYTMFCRPDATIVDDLLVYRISNSKVLLVVNASNKDKDFEWINECHLKKGYDVEIIDKSSEYAQIAVQGPKAAFLIDDVSDLDSDDIKFYYFKFGKICGAECLISRTGYTGEDGFEIYLESEKAPAVWRELLNKGEKHGVLPAGLGARDTLRLEGKLLLYGNDIDDMKTPLESKLMWTVKKEKEDFCGKNGILERKKNGISEYLVGFEVTGKGIARHGHTILDLEGNEIGIVTSGVKSPTLGKNIGLGYVRKGKHKSGNEILVDIRGKKHSAVIVKTPFYKKPPLTMVKS
ncbi:glycine cleavage system aminomethyltransferase GcvT [bacterium]|nr:glycine cleavage system aminomethyltransferase GcvT [bacterium]